MNLYQLLWVGTYTVAHKLWDQFFFYIFPACVVISMVTFPVPYCNVLATCLLD